MVICLERDADLHMAQLMPVPLSVSCFSKIQIVFIFSVPADLGSPGKGPLNGCVYILLLMLLHDRTNTSSAYLVNLHTVVHRLFLCCAGIVVDNGAINLIFCLNLRKDQL